MHNKNPGLGDKIEIAKAARTSRLERKFYWQDTVQAVGESVVACAVVKPTMPPAASVSKTRAKKIRRKNFVSA